MSDGPVVLTYDGFAHGGDFVAAIRGGEGVELWWSDGINEWSESYPRAALAVLRLGVLIAAATSDRFFTVDERGFTQSLPELADSLNHFIEGQLQ